MTLIDGQLYTYKFGVYTYTGYYHAERDCFSAVKDETVGTFEPVEASLVYDVALLACNKDTYPQEGSYIDHTDVLTHNACDCTKEDATFARDAVWDDIPPMKMEDSCKELLDTIDSVIYNGEYQLDEETNALLFDMRKGLEAVNKSINIFNKLR